METVEKKKKAKRNIKLGPPKRQANQVPPVIVVRTSRNNIVSMRRIPDEEIKALRNPTYEYLA